MWWALRHRASRWEIPPSEQFSEYGMSDKALDDLVAILDRLGPNMGLVLDHVSLERIFGRTD
jgi:hypothetical protein